MRPNFDPFDIFFFDLDGLLVDTEPLHYAAYKNVFDEIGYDWLVNFYEYRRYVQLSDDLATTLYQTFCKELPLKKLQARKQEIYRELLREHEIKLMPGAKEFVETLMLMKKHVAVVTNSCLQEVALIKSHHGILEAIPHYVTREDYARAKPSPDPYLRACKKLGASANRCVGFEDSLRGIHALNRAGIQAVFINNQYRFSKSYFSSFEEIVF